MFNAVNASIWIQKLPQSDPRHSSLTMWIPNTTVLRFSNQNTSTCHAGSTRIPAQNCRISLREIVNGRICIRESDSQIFWTSQTWLEYWKCGFVWKYGTPNIQSVIIHFPYSLAIIGVYRVYLIFRQTQISHKSMSHWINLYFSSQFFQPVFHIFSMWGCIKTNLAIFGGMNIHLPVIWGSLGYQGFDSYPNPWVIGSMSIFPKFFLSFPNFLLCFSSHFFQGTRSPGTQFFLHSDTSKVPSRWSGALQDDLDEGSETKIMVNCFIESCMI